MLVLVGCGGVIGVKAYQKHQAALIDADFETLTASMERTLLAGDQAGWLSRVDPANAALVAGFTATYRKLRALHVTRFEMITSVPPIYVEKDGDSDRLHVKFYYCFSNDACPHYSEGDISALPYIEPEMEFTWRDGRYLITDSTLGTLSERSNKPWAGGELTVADGTRVVVAASRAEAAAIPRTLKIADAAAAGADRFAKFDRVPKYHVYLASDKEWLAWNAPGAADLGDGVAAYATGQGRFGFDIVVRMSRFAGGKQDLRVTLQHEFGHAVTLMGVDQLTLLYTRADTVMIEGIAEYIGQGGASPLKSRLPDIRRYLKSHSVLDVDFPWTGKEDSAGTVSGAYGVGHFAVTCLVKKFGQDKMFAYFDVRVRQRQGSDRASEAVFGKPWRTVSSDCAQWIYKTAGVNH